MTWEDKFVFYGDTNLNLIIRWDHKKNPMPSYPILGHVPEKLEKNPGHVG